MYTNLPIDITILQSRQAIPIKLAELSYINPDAAIKYLRVWGEKSMPITPLLKEILSCFPKSEGTSIHFHSGDISNTTQL